MVLVTCVTILAIRSFRKSARWLIEDDVEIGAHTCIDRAALGRTRIGRGTKLDNMVHVGHNCDIGERVVIAAQTGISGSVVIEDDAVIGGQVGFGDHTRVQKGAIIGSKAGILPGKIVRPGVWWGIPVQPLDQYKRINAHMNRLPQMREDLKRLEEQIAELQTKVSHRITRIKSGCNPCYRGYRDLQDQFRGAFRGAGFAQLVRDVSQVFTSSFVGSGVEEFE